MCWRSGEIKSIPWWIVLLKHMQCKIEVFLCLALFTASSNYAWDINKKINKRCMKNIVQRIFRAWISICRHWANFFFCHATTLKFFETRSRASMLPWSPASSFHYNLPCKCIAPCLSTSLSLYPKIIVIPLKWSHTFINWRLKNKARERREKMCYTATLVRQVNIYKKVK